MWNRNITRNSVTGKELLKLELISLLPRLRRFSRGLARDTETADDLVQEACEHALGRLEQFHPGTRFDSWMFRILHTRWLDRLRKGKVRANYLRLVNGGAEEISIHNGAPLGVEDAMDMKTAFGSLSEEQLSAIILVCVEGYSYAEAGEILNLPSGTVASRVARGKRDLVKALYPELSDK
ncbi:RNA polymerase sigma factor [Desulfovibrio mangrovi]|uniref:RNA polymerase sigma factor n=1 Tax=Desulfovibrio mangrovi TaxID=2976983 RepID=UPI0022470754|nr:RNA polymerase sigma factor [Desulfovibrio mangrovi]UZP67521.1 RNA polymerase sigma factor [Desulfovibrio mangrovi]